MHRCAGHLCIYKYARVPVLHKPFHFISFHFIPGHSEPGEARVSRGAYYRTCKHEAQEGEHYVRCEPWSSACTQVGTCWRTCISAIVVSIVARRGLVLALRVHFAWLRTYLNTDSVHNYLLSLALVCNTLPTLRVATNLNSPLTAVESNSAD